MSQQNPTKAENIAGFFTAFLGGLQQQFQAAERRKFQADDIEANQAQFRLALQKMAQEDPQAYNDLIKDPVIQKFMDPNKPAEVERRGETIFDKFIREKREKKAGPRPLAKGLEPVTGPRLQAAQAKTQTDISLADAQQKTARVQGLIADYRANKFDAASLVDQLEALYGAVPSPEDLAVKSGAISPEAAASRIAGT